MTNRDVGRVISAMLRKSATQNTGEQKLAMAIIDRAVADLCDYAVRGYIQYLSPVAYQREASSAIDFFVGGAEPYASLIGLDNDYVREIVNTKLPSFSAGFLDLAQTRLAMEPGYAKR